MLIVDYIIMYRTSNSHGNKKNNVILECIVIGFSVLRHIQAHNVITELHKGGTIIYITHIIIICALKYDVIYYFCLIGCVVLASNIIPVQRFLFFEIMKLYYIIFITNVSDVGITYSRSSVYFVCCDVVDWFFTM